MINQAGKDGSQTRYRLYSVIYTLANGSVVCTESRSENILYPGSAFAGLDQHSDARIKLQVGGTSDTLMTRRFFGQWLRFENGISKLERRLEQSPISDTESEISLPNERKSDTDETVIDTYDTN